MEVEVLMQEREKKGLRKGQRCRTKDGWETKGGVREVEGKRLRVRDI